MRPLTERYPYLVADARYERIRRDGSVIPQGVMIVVGIDAEGFREVLDVWCAASESESNWSMVFRELKGRSLSGVSYVVSDDHSGLTRAIHHQFQGTVWQRCQIHFLRNTLSKTAKKDRGKILSHLREITGSPTLESARKRLHNA